MPYSWSRFLTKNLTGSFVYSRVISGRTCPKLPSQVLGLAGSLVLTRLIGSSVFGLTTTATDLRIYVIVALVLLAVAFIACYLPAWRATKIDPSKALRAE